MAVWGAGEEPAGSQTSSGSQILTAILQLCHLNDHGELK